MKFIQHKNLEGLHAPFSASQSAWLRYDDEKVIETYNNKKAAEMGSRLHAWAKQTIDLGLKQPKTVSFNKIHTYLELSRTGLPSFDQNQKSHCRRDCQ